MVVSRGRGYAVTRFHFGFRSLVLGCGKGLIDLLYIIIYNKLIIYNIINNIDVFWISPFFFSPSSRSWGGNRKNKMKPRNRVTAKSQSGSLSVTNKRFTRYKVRARKGGALKTRSKPQKWGTLRMPQMLVNNVDLTRKKRSSTKCNQVCQIGIVTEQWFKLLPCRTRLDVGKVELGEFHAPHSVWCLHKRLIRWFVFILLCKGTKNLADFQIIMVKYLV